jgi:AmmeMemoRadiSam system protein B
VTPRSRPALRSLETLVVPDAEHGRVLVLRDTQGVTSAYACIPPALFPIVSRFTGEWTCAQIAREVTALGGRPVDAAFVQKLAEELDEALFLDSPAFHAAEDEVRRAFHAAAIRPASHAGGAYSADPKELVAYLDDRCLGEAGAGSDATSPMTALIAPHIDPWRGAVDYGHAYAALKRGLAPEADTFIVFGTSHAAMREPFALCRKGFETPLGVFEADTDAIDQLATKCPYDPYTDELNHKREHSIEFQALFLKHVLGERPARIIPILAGLGEQQARRADPGNDPRAMALLDAVRDLVLRLGPRAVVVAGADLAHVGPRFGDPAALDERARDALRETDTASLALATAGDSSGFWRQVTGDLETRRVCGLSPIYALLQTKTAGGSARVLHYEQTIDPEEGSIVSHAAVAFHD